MSTSGAVFQGLAGLAVTNLPVSTAADSTPQADVGGGVRMRHGLAFTGADLALMALAGLIALLSGAGILLYLRRREHLTA